MAVNESEWTLRPGHLNFTAGAIRIHVYNLGMDDHDLTIADKSGRIVDARGVVAKIGAKSGQAVFTVRLKPGRYKLYCSLFANTPDSHEARGMVASIRVY